MLIKTKIKKVSNPENVQNIFQTILETEDEISREQEHFWVISLGNRQEIKTIELLALGRINSVGVQPRDIFRRAIINGATSIVICHNHPSGNIEPSCDDLKITEQIKRGGKLLGITLIDHIIISDNQYYSFRANNQL